MRRHTVRPKSQKDAKSSDDARALIWATYRRFRTWPETARALGLSNPGIVYGMAQGTRPDTPAMRALLDRQRRKQRRAFLTIKPDRSAAPPPYLQSQVCDQITRIERELRVLRAMCRLDEPKEREAPGL